MQYDYYISLTWHNSGSDNSESTFEITPEMINGLVIMNDYNKAYMPIAYATVTINKSNMDDIIKNVKTAYFDLKVQKMEQSALQSTTARLNTMYSGQCVYFIDQDINYNKELDYAAEENDKKPKNAILQTLSIGLMWKKCIEYNKQTNNDTIINTTMFNAVFRFLQGIPIVIEPFDYNENIEQLIVPPKDSLTKTIDFFNNIKVFYGTSYRFYMDPDCCYLLSSSGKATKRKGEKYDNCVINVRAIDDPAANTPGMTEDDKNCCYYMDIHVKDSYYTIDNDTTKLFNSLESIIDPSVDNTMSFLDTVNEAISNVNKLTDEFNDAIKGTIDNINGIPSKLTDFKCNFIDNCQKLSLVLIGTDGDYSGREITSETYTCATIQEAIDQLVILKNKVQETPQTGEDTTPEYDPDEEKEKIQGWIDQLDPLITNVRLINLELQKTPDEFNAISGKLTGILGGITNLPGCVNAVSALNVIDNSSMLTSKSGKLQTDSAQQQIEGNNFIQKKTEQANYIIDQMDDALSIFNKASAEWDLIAPTEGGSGEGGEGGGTEPTEMPNPFEDQEDPITGTTKPGLKSYLSSDKNKVGAYVGDSSHTEPSGGITPMIYMAGEYVNWCTMSNDLMATVQPAISNLKTRASNLKSMVNTTVTSITNIGDAAKRSLDKIVGSAKEIQAKIKSLNFNIKSLPDLKKNINAVKDIAHIGMLGISSFGVDLKISGKSSGGSGKKIIRVKNDNANMVKNIKSSIETYSNLISVTKTDLDTSIFTLNKRYIIKNYQAHSNKDGVFIMIKKMDFFTRAGSSFKISTQLEFAKVADDVAASGGALEKAKKAIISRQEYTNEIQSILGNAESIIRLAKGGINLYDAKSIITHAQDIQKSYDKLKNSQLEIPMISGGGIAGGIKNNKQ